MAITYQEAGDFDRIETRVYLAGVRVGTIQKQDAGFVYFARLSKRPLLFPNGGTTFPTVAHIKQALEY